MLTWQGMTGFPWIDAIMVQLKREGWIHPLARHAVACFLTRGDLWISWEEGMKVRGGRGSKEAWKSEKTWNITLIISGLLKA